MAICGTEDLDAFKSHTGFNNNLQPSPREQM